MMHCMFIFWNLNWSNQNHINQKNFRQFFNKFELDAVTSIMFILMTSMTFHFRKIIEIIIFEFFDLFVRSFVFLTSFFIIFVSAFFISIFRFVLTNRTLYIVIFIDIVIWLFIKKFMFSDFARIKITNFFIFLE